MIVEFIFTILLNSFFCLGTYYAIRPINREELRLKYTNWRGKSVLEENETGEYGIDDIPIFKKPFDWLWHLLNRPYPLPFVQRYFLKKESILNKVLSVQENTLELLKSTLLNITSNPNSSLETIQLYSDKVEAQNKKNLELKGEIAAWEQKKEKWQKRRWRFHIFLRDPITDCPQCFSSFYGFIFLKFIFPKISEPLLGIAFSFPITWTNLGLFLAYVMVLSLINLFIFHIYKVLVGLTKLLKTKC